MASAGEMGSSAAAAGAAGALGSATATLRRWEERQARAPAPSAMPAKGRSGIPGTTPITPAAADTMPRLTGLVASWVTRALSAAPSTPALETRKPAAMEMIRAGTWLTRPSPMVSTV